MIEHTLLPTVPESVLTEVRSESLDQHRQYFAAEQPDLHDVLKGMGGGLYDCESDEAICFLGFTYTALDRAFQRQPGFFLDLSNLPTLEMSFVARQLAEMSMESTDLRELRVSLGESFLRRQEALAQEVGGLCIDKGFSQMSMLQFASSGGMLAEILERGLADLWHTRFAMTS